MMERVDFDAAELFLAEARKAYGAGDVKGYTAACRLVAIALNLIGGPAPQIHTGPLRDVPETVR